MLNDKDQLNELKNEVNITPKRIDIDRNLSISELFFSVLEQMGLLGEIERCMLIKR